MDMMEVLIIPDWGPDILLRNLALNFVRDLSLMKM